jgi:hypothetical protein
MAICNLEKKNLLFSVMGTIKFEKKPDLKKVCNGSKLIARRIKRRLRAISRQNGSDDTSLNVLSITVKDGALKGDVMLMGYTRKRKRLGAHVRSVDSKDGIEFVCCRICGDYRRVINSQHLSKHDSDRETYMEEYHLTPDQLVAKAFRIIQSSRPAITRTARGNGLLR